MHPKLYRLLAAVEKSELPWLDKFLASPYHNANAVLRKLFRRLRPHHPDFRSVDRPKLYSHFFPGKPYRAKWINDRFSELCRCVEAFLMAQEMRRKETAQADLLRRAYRRRGLHEPLSRLAEQGLTIAGQHPPGLAHIRQRLCWRQEQFDLPEYAEQAAGHRIVTDLLALTDLQYLYTRLPYLIDLLARGKTFGEQPDTGLAPPLEALARTLAPAHPLLELYLHLLDLYRTEDLADREYQAAVDLFHRLLPTTGDRDRAFLLSKLCSLGIGQVNRGRLDFITPLLPLYQLGVARGFFSRQGFFPDDSFLNICTIGAYSGAREWTGQFITDHQALLPATTAAHTLALGRAMVAFHAGDFARVHQLLRRVPGRRAAYLLRVRSLHVRCLLYLHLEDTAYGPILRRALGAYARSLRRHRSLSAERREAYLNFCRAVGRIARLRDQGWGRQQNHRQLCLEIETTVPLALKPWLLEVAGGSNSRI